MITNHTFRPLQVFIGSPTTFFGCFNCHTVIFNDEGTGKIKSVHITDCLSKVTSVLSAITKETPDPLIRSFTLQCPCNTHCDSNRTTDDGRNIEVTLTIKHKHATTVENLLLYLFRRKTMQECMIHVSVSREDVITLIDIRKDINQLLLITTWKVQSKGQATSIVVLCNFIYERTKTVRCPIGSSHVLHSYFNNDSTSISTSKQVKRFVYLI